jgi:hypothetical protein
VGVLRMSKAAKVTSMLLCNHLCSPCTPSKQAMQQPSEKTGCLPQQPQQRLHTRHTHEKHMLQMLYCYSCLLGHALCCPKLPQLSIRTVLCAAACCTPAVAFPSAHTQTMYTSGHYHKSTDKESLRTVYIDARVFARRQMPGKGGTK